ncbi:MAG: hypothetical protein NZ890_08415 [Myxococcota bacterium]|nr:hypothetical protein [Myxococcota bacterium]
MGSKFHSEVQAREGVTYLKISGVIDEDNGLQALEGQVSPGPLVIQLAEVERINSCGVRDWVNWLSRLERQGVRPILVECAPPIVSQVNLVHNFTGGGVVKSFYAPYYCTRCQREKLLLLETRDLVQRGPPFTAPTCRCDECDGPMEFDDMEESYFAFLANVRKLLTDASVDQVVQELAAETGAATKLRPRTGTGSTAPSGTTPMTPQPAAPAGSVGGAPLVPLASPVARSPVGVHQPDGQNGSAALAAPAAHATAPGTPIALARAQAEAAQAQRLRAIHEERSPLAWGMLIVLLLVAAGLLAWVFVT